jgi:hypothetical protein
MRRQARKVVGDALLETSVRTNTKFHTCAGWHQNVFQLERTQGGGERKGSADYNAVTDELLARIEAPRRRRVAR